VVQAGGPLIRLGTKFSSVDELVTRFSPFVTETTLVMPAVNDVQVGTEGRFIVQLADKTEVMNALLRRRDQAGVSGAPPHHAAAPAEHG
jgi:hypothetical protein